MLGQPLSMLIPQVVGFKLRGQLAEGVTATDAVLTVTQMLRKKGVVGKFVEFYGPGVASLSLADRATIANMAPEYGATIGFFPIDDETLNYIRLTGRKPLQAEVVEAYAKAQGLFRTASSPDPVFMDTIELDLASVEPNLVEEGQRGIHHRRHDGSADESEGQYSLFHVSRLLVVRVLCFRLEKYPQSTGCVVILSNDFGDSGGI